MQDVINNTNKSIWNFVTCFHDVLKESSKYTYVKETDLIELKALIGLLYLRAALQLNIFKTREIFFHESSHEIFAATMSYNRFAFLIHFLEFDDKETRWQRWREDKFATIQWKMPQPIAIRKCRRDPLPLPWENWYETVQSLQAGKIWPFVLKLVWCKGPAYIFHPTICRKAWSDWCQQSLCHRLR